MRATRLVFVGGGALMAVLVALAIYVLLVLRRCDEASDVRRGSFDYRLCGVGSTFIATVPIVAVAGEPLYSWRLAEGTKPGYTELKYESVQLPVGVRATLTDFLRRSGFSERSTEGDRNWWADRYSEVGLVVHRVAGGSHVEIVHNTGSD